MNWYDRLNSGQQFVVFFIGLVLVVGSFVTGIMHLDENGVRVRTGNMWAHEAPKEMKIPIVVKGFIEYRGDNIYQRERIVEFCDVKEAKKEMRVEMRQYWQEMKEGCN